MADETTAGDLTAVTSDGTVVSVPADAPMPPDEPGHKGAEINAGATPFDPNAARRWQEGRGPGLQDSERRDPAHWQQAAAGDYRDHDAYIAGLEQELEGAKRAAEGAPSAGDPQDRIGEIEAELDRARGVREQAVEAGTFVPATVAAGPPPPPGDEVPASETGRPSASRTRASRSRSTSSSSSESGGSE